MHSSGASTPGYRQNSIVVYQFQSRLTGFPITTGTLVVRHIYESYFTGFAYGYAQLDGYVDRVAFDDGYEEVNIRRNLISLGPNVLMRQRLACSGGGQRIWFESTVRNECAGQLSA